MAGKTLNVITICGSLRKGSYNAVVQRALPSLAPAGLVLEEAPSFAAFPLYNADVQGATGFPDPVVALADAIRAADGVIIVTPEYNFSIPGDKPEIFIGGCASKFDEKTDELKDETTRNLIKQQLAAMVNFIAHLAPKG
jgi:hypothetical protein